MINMSELTLGGTMRCIIVHNWAKRSHEDSNATMYVCTLYLCASVDLLEVQIFPKTMTERGT